MSQQSQSAATALPWNAKTNSSLARLALAAIERPGAAATIFFAANAIAWIAYFCLTRLNLQRDVLEMVALGREWMPAHAKLPPLPGWAAAAVDAATNGREWPFYVLSHVFVAVTWWAVWALGVELVGRTRALLSVVTLVGVGAFGHQTGAFNHDIAQLPFWALTGLSLYRAIRSGRNRDWLLLGLWVALATLTKYAIVALLLPLAIFMVAHPQTRATFRTAGPYLAMAVASLLLVPHALWLAEHGFFAPVRYALSKTGGPPGVFDHLAHPLVFLAYQSFMAGPAVLALLTLRGRRDRIAPLPDPDSFQRWFVLAVGLGPLACMLAVSAITGWTLRGSWAVPMFDFIGLVGTMFVARRIDEAALCRFAAAALALLVATPAATAIVETIANPVLKDYYTYQFPGAELGRRIDAGWREATHDARLRYVVGNLLISGNVAFYSADRPSAYIDADPQTSPWIGEADLHRAGAVIVWDAHRSAQPPADWAARFPGLRIQPPLTLPRLSALPTKSEEIGWAILMPE